MMNQYKEETSQIHAPAELIRKTKEAMREEELRLNSEEMQRNVVVQPKPSYRKIYKWALPVAAAIFCVILLNVGLLRFGRDMGGSTSASPTDTASGAASSSDNGMAMQFGAADIAEEMEGAAEEPIDKDGSKYDTTVGAAAVSAESVYEDAEYEETGNSYIESIYGSALWLEEVEEVPSAYFYTNTDTESIIIHGVVLYVAQDLDDTWIAYVEIEGQKYVVCGELTEEDISWEDFAEEAYKLLEDKGRIE